LAGPERFSNSHEVTKVVRGGFFLRKKPLEANGFPLNQLENRNGASGTQDSRICNNKGRFIPYTYPTMAIDDPLKIERIDGAKAGTVILRLTGPVTLRNLFGMQAQLRAVETPQLTILDLSGVPYMDSAGMGAIVNYYVHCEQKRVKLIVAGVSPRVLELFKMTRVDTIISLVATVEEAEAGL
jgi:anti-anti-sigma factor